MNKEYLTVSQLTKYIKYKIDNDIPEDIFILLLKMKVVVLMLLCLLVMLSKLNLFLKMV